MPSVSSLLYSYITVLLRAVALPDWLMSLGSHWLILEFHCLCAKGRRRVGTEPVSSLYRRTCALQWSGGLCIMLWGMEQPWGEPFFFFLKFKFDSVTYSASACRFSHQTRYCWPTSFLFGFSLNTLIMFYSSYKLTSCYLPSTMWQTDKVSN